MQVRFNVAAASEVCCKSLYVCARNFVACCRSKVLVKPLQFCCHHAACRNLQQCPELRFLLTHGHRIWKTVWRNGAGQGNIKVLFFWLIAGRSVVRARAPIGIFSLCASLLSCHLQHNSTRVDNIRSGQMIGAGGAIYSVFPYIDCAMQCFIKMHFCD